MKVLFTISRPEGRPEGTSAGSSGRTEGAIYFKHEFASILQISSDHIYSFYDTDLELENNIVQKILSIIQGGSGRAEGNNYTFYFYIDSYTLTNFSKLNRCLSNHLFGRNLLFFFISTNYILPCHLDTHFHWIVLNLLEDYSSCIVTMNLVLTLIKCIDLSSITLSEFFDTFITELRGSFIYKYPILHVSDNTFFVQKVFS